MAKLYVAFAQPFREPKLGMASSRTVEEFPEKVPVTIDLLERLETEQAVSWGLDPQFVLTLSWQWLDE